MHNDVALSLSQFREAWSVMCGAAPGHRIEDRDGLAYTFSGLPIPFFNAAFIMQTAGVDAIALGAYGKAACEWAAAFAVPWMLVVTHEALEPNTNITSILEGCGLTTLMELTGMVAEAVDPIERIPDGFCMELAGDGHGILDVNAAAYGLSMDAARDAFCPSSFWSGHFPVLGRLDDGPVASAAVLMVGGVRYVALVATVPRYQRRGFAEAVMRHALALAAEAHGHTLSVLHATHAGRPVYERMGYRPISTHTIFIDKKFLGEH